MYRIIPALLCVGCVGVALFLWRGAPSTERPVPDTGNTITVTDLAGRQVTLRQPIERIVLLRSFFIYDLLPILGNDVENKLVGWDSSSQTGDRDAYLTLLERFPRLSEVTVLGDSLRDAVSPEAVLALKPDLVIIHTFMRERQLKTVEQLERAGLPLLFLSSDDPFRDPQRSLLVEELLDEFDLTDLSARNITELSGGQLQMVSIAQALAREPRILLLDEPTSNLDLQHQFEICSIIANLTASRGMSTAMALHDLNVAARFADVVYVLKDGAVHCSGPPADVLTEAMISEVYRVAANVTVDPDGKPFVTPLGLAK